MSSGCQICPAQIQTDAATAMYLPCKEQAEKTLYILRGDAGPVIGYDDFRPQDIEDDLFLITRCSRPANICYCSTDL